MANKPEYPSDHKPAMVVPEGGSSCSKCEYWEKDKPKECGNEYYIRWNGSGKIPTSPDKYCSDWFEPKETTKPGGMGDMFVQIAGQKKKK